MVLLRCNSAPQPQGPNAPAVVIDSVSEDALLPMTELLPVKEHCFLSNVLGLRAHGCSGGAFVVHGTCRGPLQTPQPGDVITGWEMVEPQKGCSCDLKTEVQTEWRHCDGCTLAHLVVAALQSLLQMHLP